MIRLAYHLLDVFAERPFAGNPLAVVSDADGLRPEQMQAIAREFNLSETAFVLAPRDPVHTARFAHFHPDHGAALRRPSDFRRRLPDRRFARAGHDRPPAFADRAGGTGRGGGLRGFAIHGMCLRGSFAPPQPPALGGVLSDRVEIAAALGLGEGEVGFDNHQPAIASAGLPFAFAPVNGLSALNRLIPDFSRFSAAFGREAAGVFVYARETADPAHHVQARVFVPALGAREDPATGSAAAAFAAVAAHFEQPENGEHEIVIEQGFAIGRPSHIGLTLRIAGGVLVETRIGGACVRIGEGALTI